MATADNIIHCQRSGMLEWTTHRALRVSTKIKAPSQRSSCCYFLMNVTLMPMYQYCSWGKSRSSVWQLATKISKRASYRRNTSENTRRILLACAILIYFVRRLPNSTAISLTTSECFLRQTAQSVQAHWSITCTITHMPTCSEREGISGHDEDVYWSRQVFYH